MLHNFGGLFSKSSSSEYEAYKWSGASDLDTTSRRYADNFKRGLVRRVIEYFLR